MTRSNLREIAVHLVYAMGISRDPAAELVETRLNEENYGELSGESEVYAQRPDKKQSEYLRTLVSGVEEKQQELDDLIGRYAVGWKVSRISAICRAILEVALYEIAYVDDVPTGVAINEAVELCKKYEEPETAAFVNGILGSYVREAERDVPGT